MTGEELRGSGTLESALAGLKTTLWAFDQVMDEFFNGEAPEEDTRTWQMRLTHMRRVLLSQVNDIVDLHGAPDAPGVSVRSQLMWEIHTTSLEKYGVVPTEDGKCFTFAKVEVSPDAD